MIEWILERLPVVIFVVIFLGQIVRGILRSRTDNPEPVAKPDEMAAQRRAQEIQAEIRRKIMERRGGGGTFTESMAPRAETQLAPPPIIREHPTEMPAPSGKSMKRTFEEFDRRVKAEPVPVSPLIAERRNAELERQEQIAEDLRSAEESRVIALRRVRQAAEAKELEARSVRSLRTASKGRLMTDLRDTENLRRAVVLREVLGPPVGLR
jgi:hypothetical protein